MSFVKVSTLDDLWIGEKVGVFARGKAVLLVNVEGTVSAYEDRCRHKGVALSAGKLAGHVLTCAVHGWCYDARTGAGINPESAMLVRYPVRIEGNDILVDVEESSSMAAPLDAPTGVGPVLSKGRRADAVVAAIREENQGAQIIDRGAYLRVSVPGCCTVTREAIERHCGEPFVFPSDLEMIMPSFKGRLSLTEDVATWQSGQQALK